MSTAGNIAFAYIVVLFDRKPNGAPMATCPNPPCFSEDSGGGGPEEKNGRVWYPLTRYDDFAEAQKALAGSGCKGTIIRCEYSI
jgi:hypothetical protein